MRWQPQSGLASLSMRIGPLGQLGQPAALAGSAWLVHQASRPLGLELLLPRVECVPRHADERGEVASRQAAAPPGVEQEQTLLRGQRGRGLLCGLDEASARAWACPWRRAYMPGLLIQAQHLRSPARLRGSRGREPGPFPKGFALVFPALGWETDSTWSLLPAVTPLIGSQRISASISCDVWARISAGSTPTSY